MKHFCLFIVLFSCAIDNIFCVTSENILQDIENGMVKLSAGGDVRIPQFLKDAFINLQEIYKKSKTDVTICGACDTVVKSIIDYRRNGADNSAMKNLLFKVCLTSTDMGQVGCQGFVDIELDTWLYIIDNKKDLTSLRVCAIYFQDSKCIDPDAKKWEIPLPPPLNVSRDTPNNKNEEEDYLKILQITDIHYDPLYVPGSNAKCNEPLCCQSGTPTYPSNAAGYWGDYNVCDMPRHSVENLLQRIKEKHLKDIDFIYYTGDIISHMSWATTKEDNTESFIEMYGWFAETFGNKTVYPLLGNHEPHPTNLFSSDSITEDIVSTQWILNLAASEWTKWLPDDTVSTIRKGGYYTVLVKPGFRIVALNSNVCFIANHWLFYEDEDPYQQLVWLVDVLAEAEKNKEKVHILSHIPPGEAACHKQWSNQFRKIVNRFASTISAQFNGHTHVDELKVFYDPDDNTRVINVAFNGASFTTFVAYNPNYRIYEVNSSSLRVENYDQYIFNLTKANENKSVPPKWYKLYSFKEAYGLDDLSNNKFHELLERMSNDTDLMYQYFRFQVRDSDKLIKEGCDKKCLEQLLCYIPAVETDLSLEC